MRGTASHPARPRPGGLPAGGGTAAQWVFRTGFYLLGLFFLALGVVISIHSELGISPVNSLPYVVSRISGRELSTCVIVIYCIYIGLQWVLLRREFRPINLLQILFSTVFGCFLDFCKELLGDFSLPGYGGKLILLAISILVISVGVILYVEVELVPMPMEGLTLTLSRKWGVPFHQVKMAVDCTVVGLGAALSLVFFGGLEGIREGTVLTALFTGKVIALVKKPLLAPLRTLCFAPGE